MPTDDKQPIPMPTPNGPKLKAIQHQFSEAQLQTLQAALEQRKKYEEFVSWFLSYVQTEAKLPKSVDGWGLAFDQEGKPYMLGHVPETGKPKE